MLRWPFKKKPEPGAARTGEAAGGAPGGDWDFLRGQPDHDEEEMAGVHARPSETVESTLAAEALEAVDAVDAGAAVEDTPAPWSPARRASNADELAWLR